MPRRCVRTQLECPILLTGGGGQNTREVLAEAFGRNGPIESRAFSLHSKAPKAPDFVARFGLAYAQELKFFLDHVARRAAFPVDQNDGLRATEVLESSRPIRLRRFQAGRTRQRKRGNHESR